MRQKLPACLLPAILTCLMLHAQNNGFNTADSLAMHFIKSIRNNNKEKILLETDRKVYVTGERLWFNAYLLRPLNNRLDTTSKNLFVDLVNDSDKIIKQLVLNVYSLHTDGAITLGDSLPTGYYWLRSYTQNILHTDTGAICVQPLFIKNLAGNNDVNLPGKSRLRPSVQTVVEYFPEGGALIAGINSTGALQVKDGNGNPMVVTGSITDDKDSVITNFTTNRFGLARITFYPLWYKKYFAVMNVNAHMVKYPLTEWNPFAAQLAVTRQGADFIQAYVTLEDSIYSRKFTSYILGISGDSVCFAGIGRGMYQVDIPTANFPGGIATLLLFDGNQRLLSERKVFINKSNYNIKILADKPNYAAREKAHIGFEVTGPDGRPLVASLNVSVQDNRLMKMSDEIKNDTIQPLTAFELNDWLKLNCNSFSADETDLFMLAQHPAFTNWQNRDMTTTKYTDNTVLLRNIVGEVVNKKQLPLKQKIVTAISVTGVNPYIAMDTTNDEGMFQLPLPSGTENMLVKIQVKNKRDIPENDSILISSFPFPQFKTPVAFKILFAGNRQAFTQHLASYHIDTVFVGTGKEWLAPVTVRSRTIKKPEADFDETKRVSSLSYIISGDKFGHGQYGELANAILMVPGFSMLGGKLVLHGPSAITKVSEPLVVMDGVMITGFPGVDSSMPVESSEVLSFLKSLDARSIDFIEVLRGPEAAAYGMLGGNGVILINTKARSNEFVKDYSAYKILQPVTYHTAPRFVMPDYAVKQIKNSKAPDPRVTIYWKSNLLTGLDGKASVDFYTADEATTYSVVVSGLTANGEYVYKRISLNRK